MYHGDISNILSFSTMYTMNAGKCCFDIIYNILVSIFLKLFLFYRLCIKFSWSLFEIFISSIALISCKFSLQVRSQVKNSLFMECFQAWEHGILVELGLVQSRYWYTYNMIVFSKPKYFLNLKIFQLGEICFSLRYVPTTGKLTVLVMVYKIILKREHDVYAKSLCYVMLLL